ncbi:MAG: TRAP transporter small permease subunit [Planctomycetota bacterium]
MATATPDPPQSAASSPVASARPAPYVCILIDTIHKWVFRLVAALTLVMVAVGAFNALARNLDGSRARHPEGWIARTLDAVGVGQLSSNAYLELQWYLFATILLLAAAHTLRNNAHVRVDVLYDRFSAKNRARINLFGHALLLLPFCGFMLWVSWDGVLESWRVREVSPNPAGLARYPIKAAIPVAFLLLALQGVSEIIKQWVALRQGASIDTAREGAHV